MTTAEEFLVHYGVKGMRWGVIREKAGSARTRATAAIRGIDKKKAAVVAGSVLTAAAVAAGAAYMAKQRSELPKLLDDLNDHTVDTGDQFVQKVMAQPTGIIHATRGKNRGFSFRQSGGLIDPLPELTIHDDGNSAPPSFSRYGDRNEKVFGFFLDPEGRKDRAGRVIPHTVILPEHLSAGVHNAEDLQRVAWPLIKDDFDKFYDS